MQIAKHWRLKGARYRLEGARDPETGVAVFPAPANAETLIPLIRSGVVESFATVGQAATGFNDHAVVALVRLNDGPLVTAQLTDTTLSEVTIGMPVEMVTRKLRDLGPDGLIVYGYKFRPCLESQHTITAIADPNNTVAESNEGNNQTQQTITIK